MIELSLTEEQVLLQSTARDFAQNEIKPIVEQIESMGHERTGAWDLCLGMLKKATKLGFTTMLIPEEYGGAGRDCRDIVVVLEEIGTVDVGIAADYFNTAMTYPRVLIEGGTPQQCEKWLTQFCNSEVFVWAGAQNEADVAGSELFCFFPDPRLGLKTYARLEGDEYVINGSKSAFITNAGVANAYIILCRTDLTKPQRESLSMFYVPAGTPGLSIGKRTEMIGSSTTQHAEVFLDNVRVPRESLIGGEGQALDIFSRASDYMVVGLAACYVGLARAAYDYALDYAKQRMSWGMPLIKHQAVGLKLAEMRIQVDAARLMVWDAAYAVDSRAKGAGAIKAPAAKTFAVDAAIKNAENAVKILGGYGLCKEYRAEKYLRDAWMGYSCDFTGDILRLGMVDSL